MECMKLEVSDLLSGAVRQVGIATCCEVIFHCSVTGVSEGDSIDWEPVG